MKTIGIIAEYNPFHNGHQYQIAKAKERTGADACIVVMSGDFTQRGTPAVWDKHKRTHMALLGGADLVLELPACYATASAAYFARGAVTLLNSLGVVDVLCFGSECPDTSLLQNAAVLFAREPEPYQKQLKKALKDGLSYPAARARAYASCQADLTAQPAAAPSDLLPQRSLPDPGGFLTQPNNILGVEYCKCLLQLHSSIRPMALERLGAGHHEPLPGYDSAGYDNHGYDNHGYDHHGYDNHGYDNHEYDNHEYDNHEYDDHGYDQHEDDTPGYGNASLAQSGAHRTQLPQPDRFASARAIRGILTDPREKQPFQKLQPYLPQTTLKLLSQDWQNAGPITASDFSGLLHYRLLTDEAGGFSHYLDISSDLSDKIQKKLPAYEGFDSFCDTLKSKDLTHSRISRALCHILLQSTQADMDAYLAAGCIFYARLLGFGPKALPVLSAIKRNSSIPLLAKPADAPGLLAKLSPSLEKPAQTMFARDIYASHVYQSVVQHKFGRQYLQQEYSRPVITL